MKRSHVVIATVAAFAACLPVPLSGVAAGPPDVVCSQVTNSFAGTARDLIVPTGGYCAVTGATITHDLIQQDRRWGGRLGDEHRPRRALPERLPERASSSSTVGHDIVAAGDESGAGVFDTAVGHDMLALGEDSGFDIAGVTVVHDVRLLGLADGMHAERLTIGHDFFASKPQTVQTGQIGPDTPGGPVNVGHDFAIDGSPDLPFVFDGICYVNVAHDFSITNRSVTLGFGIGNICARNGLPANTVGRDMVITGNTRSTDSSARRRSSSATTTSAATSCSATTQPCRAGPSRCRGTSSVATRPAQGTTRQSPSTDRTAPGARTPAADSRVRGTRARPGPSRCRCERPVVSLCWLSDRSWVGEA